jgi:MFS family permease
MAVISLILFLTFLDNTVISATLSNVQSSLHAGVTQLQWVVSGYALTFASLMLICGTLGDLYGRKRVMLIGVGSSVPARCSAPWPPRPPSSSPVGW